MALKFDVADFYVGEHYRVPQEVGRSALAGHGFSPL
jgi:hypothetical protein